MAYQGTNLVPSSQADSCNMHGFAAAEVGLLCLFAKCGAAFPDAEALDLHMKGHDFGNVRLSDRAISDTFIGYGTSSGYGVDTYVGDIGMDNCTGYVDSSGPFENSVGATPYASHDFNPSYAIALPVGNTVGPGSVAMNNYPDIWIATPVPSRIVLAPLPTLAMTTILPTLQLHPWATLSDLGLALDLGCPFYPPTPKLPMPPLDLQPTSAQGALSALIPAATALLGVRPTWRAMLRNMSLIRSSTLVRFLGVSTLVPAASFATTSY